MRTELKPGRIIGIDYGDVRTGIALSDPTGIMALGLETIEAAGKRKLTARIKEICEANGVVAAVIGNPINMNGTYGERSDKVKAYAAELEKALGIPVILFDERCTTMEAHRIMNETDTRGKKRKAAVDTLSAQIILQNYMDMEKERKRRAESNH